MSKVRVACSVVLSYAIRIVGKVVTITFGLVGSVLIAMCGLLLAVVLLLSKPFEWIQRARRNAIRN